MADQTYNPTPPSGGNSLPGTELQKVNEEIYKRNLELAIVNKTLSLLGKLYQISLLGLDPASLSIRISETIRGDLNMETAGVFMFNEKTDALSPFHFAKSERLSAAMSSLGFLFRDNKIPDVSKNPLLKQVALDKKPAMTNNLRDVWGGVIDAAKLDSLAEQSRLKTILLYPLLAQGRMIGVLVLGLNRDYAALNKHEQNSIQSLTNVVAVALENSLLYEQLKAANEELKSLDKARAEFISIASHQLRTPPATVKWYLASVLNGDYGPLPQEIDGIIKKTQNTNNHLISLIEDMLNVSRIERGKMEFLFDSTDTEELARFAYEQLIPMALDKKLQLSYDPPKSPLPKIMADKEKLRQVMNNLIDNAIKYTKQGTVAVSLYQEGDEIRFKVKDSGKGISAEEQDSIFQKYTRGKESVKQSAGLGLGLYVAKIIIEQHKGKIWAESEGEGKGSSFIFSLPIHNDLKQTTLVDLSKQK